MTLVPRQIQNVPHSPKVMLKYRQSAHAIVGAQFVETTQYKLQLSASKSICNEPWATSNRSGIMRSNRRDTLFSVPRCVLLLASFSREEHDVCRKGGEEFQFCIDDVKGGRRLPGR